MLINYKTMDINMLLSLVNMKLRNEKESLHDFCITYQIEESMLIERFKKKGLLYDVTQNRFKQNQ